MRYTTFLLLTIACQRAYCHGASELIVHSSWQLIEPRIGTQEWIMVGSITFKNKTRQPQVVEELILQWHGPLLPQLTGSLFRKKYRHQFMAIEEFCLADSEWDAHTQQLSLKMCTPVKLASETTMYLTVLVPTERIATLKNGYFSIDPQTLPASFKLIAQDPSARIYPGQKK